MQVPLLLYEICYYSLFAFQNCDECDMSSSIFSLESSDYDKTPVKHVSYHIFIK